MLSDSKLRRLKPAARPFKLGDAGGLYAYVSTAGGVSWRMNYAFDGKAKTLTFGRYPVLSLAEARQQRDEAKRTLARGVDPMAPAIVAAKRRTFGEVAQEIVAKAEADKLSDKTMAKLRWLADDKLKPLGAASIAGLTAADVRPVLLAIDSGAETQRRARAFVGRVMRHACAMGYRESDPTPALLALDLRSTVRHQAAIVDPKAFGALLRAVWAYEGAAVVKAGLQLLALTAARPSELRLAEWREIDLDAALWTVPAQRMKMRRAHRAPLARQAVAILKSLHKRRRGDLVLPGLRPNRPLSENTFNMALRATGFDGATHVAHGFRSSFSTLVAPWKRYDSEVVECALAHTVKGVRGVYQRGDYLAEREGLMQEWADECDCLRADV